jgi:Glycosyltransferase family 87
VTGKPPNMEVWRRVTQVSVTPSEPSDAVTPTESGLGGSNGHKAPAEASSNGMTPQANGANGHPPASTGSTIVDPSLLNATDVPAEPAGSAGGAAPASHGERFNPIEWLMSFIIRKLAWSRLSNPRVAVAISGFGLLLGMIVGATAPNPETLRWVKLPLSVLPSLLHPDAIASTLLYTGDICTCLGLAGMLWAHSQGWRPDPRRLLLAATGVVAIMVCLTPVGSSDTASYAAYGRIAASGQNPYSAASMEWLKHHYHAYWQVVGFQWTKQPSVYGPVATWIQWFAARIGGSSVETTIWVLMILNGLAFLGVGLLLLKTSKDPIRATLFWTANPVLIQQLVGGGHFDTFVAAAAIVAIQLARRSASRWNDIAIGVVIGLGCGIKITAALVAIGLAWPLLLRREWLRIATMAVAALATVAVEYSFYGLDALKPLFAGSKWITLPSPWWFVHGIGDELGVPKGTLSLLISVLWITAMFVVAWFVLKRISAEQPREIVAPFALTYAWVLTAPWVFAWYTALPWVVLAQVPRNRFSRWLTIVTVVLAIWHSSGGWVPPGRI